MDGVKLRMLSEPPKLTAPIVLSKIEELGSDFHSLVVDIPFAQ